jgi:hypothetical protein
MDRPSLRPITPQVPAAISDGDRSTEIRALDGTGDGKRRYQWNAVRDPNLGAIGANHLNQI